MYMCNICNSVLVGSSQTSECTGQTLWQILWQTSGPHDQCESKLAGELTSAITAPNPFLHICTCPHLQILVTVGAYSALSHAFSAFIQDGDEVGDFMCLVAYCSYVTVHRKIWLNTGTYYWIFILLYLFIFFFIFFFFSFTHSTFRYKALQVL